MRWDEVPIHLIDFEGHRDYGVIEYGVVTLAGGRLVDVETRLCRAHRRLRPDEVRFHGLTHRDVEGVRPFTDEWSRFSSLRQSGVLGAHHAVFENALLKSVWPFPNYSEDFQHPGRKTADWGPWVDTRVLYQSRYPGLANYRLSELVKQFGLTPALEEFAQTHCPAERSRYHCALYDALACALLLLHLMDAVESGAVSVAGLLRESRGGRREVSDPDQSELFS
jgi:DNA polymerase-3 subunit epsilon